MSNQNFQHVRNLTPGRSLFDLSYEKKFTCDMGQLIPVMCDEVIPGDYFKIANQSVIRFQPLVAPVLHEIYQYVHYFFVPYRLLWDEWEDFISGGADGKYDDPPPEWNPVLNSQGSLWDFLGFPIDVDPAGAYPLDFPRRAYNLIFNEYYRDETLQTEVLLTNEKILQRNWEKDYFTSALTDQQRGVAPALPISGLTHAVFADSLFVSSAASINVTVSGALDTHLFANDPESRQNLRNVFNSNTVDLSTASTFDIADLRLAFQIQKFMERNARSGVRYTEFLKAHYGVSPRDDRLQRPEYIGGSKAPVIISEVLQTSSTDVTSPQGNLAGHGISVNAQFSGKYHATEFGLIMGIFSVMPRPAYQQGIDRQWLRKTRYDFPFPEFVNLSEQAISNAELCVIDGNATHNQDIFGYQGRFDELRTKQSLVVSEMRDTFDYWHLGRVFDPATPPVLNESFIKCIPSKRIFAVQTEPGLIVSFGNVISAYRPIPIQAEPGLIDHN